MKLTIIPSDGVVGVDGVFRPVSMAGIDPDVHAVHFDDALNAGEVEYKERGRASDAITALGPFGVFIGRWNAAAPPPPPPPPPRTAGPGELLKALIKKGVVTQAELNAELP